MWLQLPLAGRASRVLDSPTRRRLLDFVESQPGLPASALARRLGIGVVSLLYHLQIMEAAGLVQTLRLGRRRLVFAPEALREEDPDELAALASPAARRVALAIAQHPRIGVTELAALISSTPRVVYHHLRRLRNAGLLEAPDPSSYRGLVATPRLLVLLSRW